MPLINVIKSADVVYTSVYWLKSDRYDLWHALRLWLTAFRPIMVRYCFVLFLCSEPCFVLSLQSEGARLQREMKAYIAAVKGDSS